MTEKKAAPKKAAKKVEEPEAKAVLLDVDGKKYRLEIADTSAADDLYLRQETGAPLIEWLQRAQEAPGVDVVGVLLWAARVHAGETNLALDDVMESVSYASTIEIDTDDTEGEV